MVLIVTYIPCAIMLHFSNMVFQSLVPKWWFVYHSRYRSIGQELEQVSLARICLLDFFFLHQM